jgi:hypothetical protein
MLGVVYLRLVASLDLNGVFDFGWRSASSAAIETFS